jgi:hypothetical protein
MWSTCMLREDIMSGDVVNLHGLREILSGVLLYSFV